MSKKLSGNGRWESSRMMLPQHKETIISYNTKLTKKSRPIIMGDEWEEFSRKITESLQLGTEVTIEVFDEYDNRFETGVVKEALEHSKKLKLIFENGYEWIDYNEIVGVKSHDVE